MKRKNDKFLQQNKMFSYCHGKCQYVFFFFFIIVIVLSIGKVLMLHFSSKKGTLRVQTNEFSSRMPFFCKDDKKYAYIYIYLYIILCVCILMQICAMHLYIRIIGVHNISTQDFFSRNNNCAYVRRLFEKHSFVTYL